MSIQFTLGAVALMLLASAGCAVNPAHDYPPYPERAQSRVVDDVQIRAAALSAEEARTVYGVPLEQRLIQPVWVEIQNNGDTPHWLLFPGLDPNFFPSSEAAEAMAPQHNASADLDRRFRELGFANPVPPGQTVSGFVLTNLHEGVKLLQVDVVADKHAHSVSFLAFVPGLRADYEQEQNMRATLQAANAEVDYADESAFRDALEALPCCVTNKSGNKPGDPLNLVIVGDVNDAFPALIRRGWSATEVTWSGSIMRMAKSVMNRERYPYSPISNLYLYGRPQDIALQKARDTIHQRNHLRLWRSPMRFRGKPVWVGQISRDIGSRMTVHSPTLFTHKIDPDVDEARHALFEDLAYSQSLQAWGRVAGVGAAPRSAPRQNLTNDPYYTNGMRFVLVFDSHPTSLTDVGILPWQGGKLLIDDATLSHDQ